MRLLAPVVPLQSLEAQSLFIAFPVRHIDSFTFQGVVAITQEFNAPIPYKQMALILSTLVYYQRWIERRLIQISIERPLRMLGAIAADMERMTVTAAGAMKHEYLTAPV